MGPRSLLLFLMALALNPSVRVGCAEQRGREAQPDLNSATTNSTSQSSQEGDLWVVLVGTSRNW